MRLPDQLYHLTEAANLPSILEHGLISTEGLLTMVGVREPERRSILRSYRPRQLDLAPGITIRDQAPMPPSALAPALDDGLTPADWYALVNRFVFMWPDRGRLDRQKRACGDRPQILLQFNTCELVEQFNAAIFLSPINSGNARRKPARRGRDTLMPYGAWLKEGWQQRSRSRRPAEVLFDCVVPAKAPYLMTTSGV